MCHKSTSNTEQKINNRRFIFWHKEQSLTTIQSKKQKNSYCVTLAGSPCPFHMLTQNSNYGSCELTSAFKNYELYIKHAFSSKQLPLIKTRRANTTQVQPTAVPSNISNCLLSNTLNKLKQTVFTTNNRKKCLLSNFKIQIAISVIHSVTGF